jgi:caffeoyl-CoA O-methyltransferase
MYFVHDLDKYIVNLSSEEDQILADLNRETHLKETNARMISGHPQGRFLEIISKLTSPAQILEIGTFTGYSAICLSRGLKPGGMLHTIEINDELESIAKKYFQKAGVDKNIKTYFGNAIEIIPRLEFMFDLVFIDADKTLYPDYYNLVIDKTRQGGIILADNVLWNGKVIDKDAASEPGTKSILNFNKIVKNDPRVEVVILPLRDGISVIRKL